MYLTMNYQCNYLFSEKKTCKGKIKTNMLGKIYLSVKLKCTNKSDQRYIPPLLLSI